MKASIIPDSVLLAIEEHVQRQIPFAKREHWTQTLGFRFPSVASLRTVVDAVFWASLLSEEGRAVLSKVSFREPRGLDCHFETPSPLDEERLRKLSPFVESPGMALSLDDHGNIDGIVSRNHGLLVLATHPGRIAIALWPNVLQVLDRGRWIAVNGGRLEASARIQTVLHAPTPVERLLQSFQLVSVVRHARRSKRGALLVCIRDANTQGLEFVEKNNVARFLSYQHLRMDWDATMPALEQRSRADLNALHHSVFASMIAAGAGMDGATVFSNDLQLLSLGAKIKAPLSDFEVLLTVLPSDGVELTKREDLGGARHQSAAALVHDNHDAGVVAVSQDGYVTLFTWDEQSQGVRAVKGLERYFEAEWTLENT